ncbi:MAG: AAA family ATPase [Alphaproteobacteria bacterium]
MKINAAIEINEQFQRALHLMDDTDQCLFITGKAGTGKSTLLSHYCASTRKKPVVLAPTGVAALNVKGQTIHNFFNFYVDVTPQKIREKKTKPRGDKTRLYKKLKSIIIDEVSMVRADLLDCIDVFLRMYGPVADAPFGGVQMIFVGDLYQLPPVVTGQEKEIFSTHYKTPFFFSAHVMENFSLEIVELEKVYRQKDQHFVDLLNCIRNNSVEEADIERLNSRFMQDTGAGAVNARDGFFISLTATNKKADEINDENLQSLNGKLHVSQAQITGDFGREYFPTATELQFRVGAQIMLLNNDSRKRWVNGSIGVIEAYKLDEDGERYVEVVLQDDDEEAVRVYLYTWEVFRFTLEEGAIVSEPAGSFIQYPFRLAWAITIHKSQGKTFDHVMIDIGGGTFVAGQMYVALSRCTSFEGIFLKTRIKKQHIRTDYRIFSFLTGYQYRKAELELSLEDKVALIQRAISGKAGMNMVYLKANDTKSVREIVPRQVGPQTYKGKSFTGMTAFCLQHQEDRTFRVDRILKLEIAGKH